jgi:hypothetical protein
MFARMILPIAVRSGIISVAIKTGKTVGSGNEVQDAK